MIRGPSLELLTVRWRTTSDHHDLPHRQKGCKCGEGSCFRVYTYEHEWYEGGQCVELSGVGGTSNTLCSLHGNRCETTVGLIRKNGLNAVDHLLH